MSKYKRRSRDHDHDPNMDTKVPKRKLYMQDMLANGNKDLQFSYESRHVKVERVKESALSSKLEVLKRYTCHSDVLLSLDHIRSSLGTGAPPVTEYGFLTDAQKKGALHIIDLLEGKDRRLNTEIPNNFHVLYGAPNIGKSTLAQFVAFLMCRTGKDVVYLQYKAGVGRGVDYQAFMDNLTMYADLDETVIVDQINFDKFSRTPRFETRLQDRRLSMGNEFTPLILISSGHYMPPIVPYVQMIDLQLESITEMKSLLNILYSGCSTLKLNDTACDKFLEMFLTTTRSIGNFVTRFRHVDDACTPEDLQALTVDSLNMKLFPDWKERCFNWDHMTDEYVATRWLYYRYLEHSYQIPVEGIQHLVSAKTIQDENDLLPVNCFLNMLRLEERSDSNQPVPQEESTTTFRILKDPVFVMANETLRTTIKEMITDKNWAFAKFSSARSYYRMTNHGAAKGLAYEYIVGIMCQHLEIKSLGRGPYGFILQTDPEVLPAIFTNFSNVAGYSTSKDLLDSTERAQHCAHEDEGKIFRTFCLLNVPGHKDFEGYDFAQLIKKKKVPTATLR